MSHDDRDLDDRDGEEIHACRYCHGRGCQSVDGGSLGYRCPDCNGSGREEEED